MATEVKVNVEEFLFNHLLCHVDTFAIHIPFCFPRLMSGFLLSQQLTILNLVDVVRTPSICVCFKASIFGCLCWVWQCAWTVQGYSCYQSYCWITSCVSVPLANCLLQALMVESRFLTRQINELSDRRTVLKSVSVIFVERLWGLMLRLQILRANFILQTSKGNKQGGVRVDFQFHC